MEVEFSNSFASASMSSLARQVRQRDFFLINRLRSIEDDAAFVTEFCQSHPSVPVLANLRCGSWYVPPSLSTHSCYFKSADGHTSHWMFNLRRLNFHLIELASTHNGAIIVDSTRKGKRFPDSMSRTIPIWCCVVNRAIQRLRKEDDASECTEWDISLHLPVWVSPSEAAQIENRIEGFVDTLLASAADLSLLKSLEKPLRPLWMCRRSPEWSQEQHSAFAKMYVPLLCVSVSEPEGEVQKNSRRGWHYVQGAGDDQENWARKMTPSMFWKHRDDILVAENNIECTRIVDEIVEQSRERLCTNRAENEGVSLLNESPAIGTCKLEMVMGTLATEPLPADAIWTKFSHIIWCSSRAVHSTENKLKRLCPLPIVDCKTNKRSLQLNLGKALNFFQRYQQQSDSSNLPILLASDTDDHSIPMCLASAFLAKFFSLNDGQVFIRNEPAAAREITKQGIREMIQFVQRSEPQTYPSRLLMQQLNRFFL